MKKFLVIMVLSLLWCNFSNAGSMIPLKTYVKNNSEYLDDPITYTYVINRCAANHLYAAAINHKKYPKTAAVFLKSYAVLVTFSTNILVRKLNYTKEDADEKTKNESDKMFDLYSKDGDESYVRTGTYMMNNYIGEDGAYCKGFADLINELFKK